MRITKKQLARARRIAWEKALAEGRVVRSFNGLMLTSYPTKEEAEHMATADGSEIVIYPSSIEKEKVSHD